MKEPPSFLSGQQKVLAIMGGVDKMETRNSPGPLSGRMPSPVSTFTAPTNFAERHRRYESTLQFARNCQRGTGRRRAGRIHMQRRWDRSNGSCWSEPKTGRAESSACLAPIVNGPATKLLSRSGLILAPAFLYQPRPARERSETEKATHRESKGPKRDQGKQGGVCPS